MVSNNARKPRTASNDSFELMPAGFVGIPDTRNAIWGEGEVNTFVFSVPETEERAKLVVSEHADAGTYLACNHGKVQIFVRKATSDEEQTAEQFAKQFRGKQIFARGELWRKVWEDGREGLYFDLIDPVVRQDGMVSSHEFKVHGPQLKKDREPVFSTSVPGCDGFVAIYTYVPFTRT